MQIKTSVLVALVGVLAKLAVALPPACLLAAVNTQPNPGDMQTICGSSASDVRSAIQDLCGDNVEEAETEFEKTCQSAGQTMSSTSSASSSTTTSGSSTARSGSSASSTSSAKSSTSHSSAGSSNSPSGPAVVTPGPTGGAASPTGAYSPSGNGTLVTSPRATTVPTETSAPGSSFTGAAARSLAGSFAGVAVVAAGFIIAL